MDYDELARQAGSQPAVDYDKLAREAAGKKPGMLDDALETGKNIGGFAADSARKGVAALFRGWEGLSKTAGEVPGNLGFITKLVNATKGDSAESVIKKIDVPSDGSLWDASVRGAGGALSVPVPGAGIIPQALSGGVGGLTGETAKRYAGGITQDPKWKPKLEGVSEFLGNFVGGGLTGFALGPRQSNAQKLVRESLQNQTPADFTTARANADRFKQAGSTTATAAESFPPNSAVMALAEETRGSNLDNALRNITENRPKDLQGLGNEFLNRISKTPVDENTIANSATGSANGILAKLKQDRGAMTKSEMLGINLPDAPVKNFSSAMYQLGGFEPRKSAKAAYDAVAEAIAPGGKPITNVQELSFAIKELKDSPKNPNSLVSTGAIGKTDLARAISIAEEHLSQISPEFKKAMANYTGFTRLAINPAHEGPIGSMADRNPITALQAPPTRLDGILKGNSPQRIEDFARDMNRPNLTMGQTTNPLDIARALAQKSLDKGSTNPGANIRGLEGSRMEEKMNALLRAGDADVTHINAPLRAADELQAFMKPAGHRQLPEMGFGQMLIRPFRTADMMITGSNAKRTNAEVARLLADPGNIPELQRIAMFNPDVRRMLSLRGLINPVLKPGQEE